MRTPRSRASVVDLNAFRRRDENVIESITLVFDGVNYGTIPVRVPYAPGRPIRLFLTPCADAGTAGPLAGRLDALVTDDETLSAELRPAQ